MHQNLTRSFQVGYYYH